MKPLAMACTIVLVVALHVLDTAATSFDDARDRAMAAVVEDDFAFPQLKVVAVSRDDD